MIEYEYGIQSIYYSDPHSIGLTETEALDWINRWSADSRNPESFYIVRRPVAAGWEKVIENDDYTRYYDYPEHPLFAVRQVVLDAARKAMGQAACCGDVSESLVDPIADMVVMELLPWLKSEAFVEQLNVLRVKTHE